MRRRDFLKTALAGGIGASLSGAYLQPAWAQNPIKIGLPTVLSGGNAQYGTQAKRACELFGKEINAKGGILGRPVQFIYEDTASDPATAVRKAQKLVEKDGVKFLTGTVLSSEALAVSAKCPEWKVILMSTINGAGSLTAKAWNRYFFRVNTSGPMGARAVSLYLAEAPMKRFFGLGSDYAWGRDSVASFERNERRAVGDHFGWHAATGPDVDEREGHVFANNLMVASDAYTRPLLQFEQPKALCERLSKPQAARIDGNVYVRAAKPGAAVPLVVWSPATTDTCLAPAMSLEEFRRLAAGVESRGRYLDHFHLAAGFLLPQRK